jgi:nitrate/nitrite-specific signal transduction histidine kinase
MRGMRERAAVIDAELDVRARAEGGTGLVLSVPA